MKDFSQYERNFRTVFAAGLFFLALIVVSSLFSYCTENKEREQRQNPASCFVLGKEGFSIGYDGRLKQASWVYEELTKENLNGKADRNQHRFIPDSNLPEIVRALLDDYKNSGFDRGHLAPAANHAHSNTEMTHTFLLSNASPQTPSFNRGYWKKLERYVRKLVRKHGKVQVVTGPLFLSEQSADGRRYVSYEVIGKSDIAVPTHFFKVLWTPNGVEAYILPNKKISPETPLNSFKTTLKKIEKVSGVVFSQIR